MKKYAIYILVFLCLLLSVNAKSSVINNQLNGLGYHDFVVDMTDRYHDNVNQTFGFRTDEGLSFFMTNNFYLTNIVGYNNSDQIYGAYFSETDSIYLNVEQMDIGISQGNFTLNESYDLMANVLMHEIVHRIASEKSVEVLTSSYDLNFTTFPTLTFDSQYRILNLTTYYYEHNNESIYPIPDVTLSSIYFPNIFNTQHYPPSHWHAESYARLTAICFIEKTQYTYYWDMFTLADYDLCTHFDYHPALDNLINEQIEFLIEAYSIEILGLEYGSLESNTNKLPDIGTDLSNFMSNSITGITTFILSFSVAVIVLGLFILVVDVVRRF